MNWYDSIGGIGNGISFPPLTLGKTLWIPRVRFYSSVLCLCLLQFQLLTSSIWDLALFYYITVLLLDFGKNGPLPSILEIICSETLFPNYIAMYHFFGPIAAFSWKIFYKSHNRFKGPYSGVFKPYSDVFGPYSGVFGKSGISLIISKTVLCY